MVPLRGALVWLSFPASNELDSFKWRSRPLLASARGDQWIGYMLTRWTTTKSLSAIVTALFIVPAYLSNKLIAGGKENDSKE